MLALFALLSGPMSGSASKGNEDAEGAWTTHWLLGVQQSPDADVALLVRPCISQTTLDSTASSISPKSLAIESQRAAMSTSLADKPLGL